MFEKLKKMSLKCCIVNKIKKSYQEVMLDRNLKNSVVPIMFTKPIHIGRVKLNTIVGMPTDNIVSLTAAMVYIRKFREVPNTLTYPFKARPFEEWIGYRKDGVDVRLKDFMVEAQLYYHAMQELYELSNTEDLVILMTSLNSLTPHIMEMVDFITMSDIELYRFFNNDK